MIALSIVNSPRKIAGALVAGAVTSGLFASAGLGLAPTANATCASFFGIGNSADCTSTLFSVAFAIGDGAQAHADGLFGAAFVVGTTPPPPQARGLSSTWPPASLATATPSRQKAPIANWATNIGGNGNTVTTQGSLLNTATNILGSGNTVTTQGGYVNWARNVFGDNNTVTVLGGVANWARNVFGDTTPHGTSRQCKHGPKHLRQRQHLHDTRRLRELCSKPVRRATNYLTTAGRLFRLGHQFLRQRQHRHVDRRVFQRGEEHCRQRQYAVRRWPRQQPELGP